MAAPLAEVLSQIATLNVPDHPRDLLLRDQPHQGPPSSPGFSPTGGSTRAFSGSSSRT